MIVNLYTATSSSSIRMSINMLYLDEFAFVEDAETFILRHIL